ncbi:hypothetical protein [Kribbella qitaiheensis]|uniref:hypothetical protein n=1 Tax=Kribbella qitaiheensis TaxID=1544730 RepID=UPI0019D6741B|nr:hypothetical protein [Kribbella qitaiheensis]
MHTSSLTGSRWLLPLAAGLPAAVIVALFVGFSTPAPWTAALICGVIAGALLAGLRDHQAQAQRELIRNAVGDLPIDLVVSALRAMRKGAVPADPEIREAALNIAEYQLTLTPSRSVAMSVFPLTGAVLAIVSASTAPDWVLLVFALPTLLALACTGVLLWQAYYLPRHLRERIRRLTSL